MRIEPLLDVMIVGGGLAGSLCALSLASVGARCVVLEKNRFDDLIARDTRTTAINSGALPLLTDLGIWSALQPGAGAIRRIEIVSDGSQCTFDDTLNDLQPFGYIVHNPAWRRVLRAAMESHPLITLVEEVTVTALTSDPTGIAAVDAGGRTWRAQLLVAADGRESPVRALAGIDVRRHAYTESAMVGTVRHAQPHHETAFEIFLPTGPLAFLPLHDEYTSAFVWSEPTDHGKARLGLGQDLFLQALSSQPGSHLGALQLIDTPQMWPLTRTQASTYVRDRVVLVGDAAHAIHPIAGQGLNLTLRDLVALRAALQPRLEVGLPLAGSLSMYNRLRLLDVAVMAEATHGLNTLFLSAAPIPKIARRAGLRLLNRLPMAKRPFVRHATGLSRLARLGS